MTPSKMKKKYTIQLYNAAQRDIPFHLTFEEWRQIWLDSGHIDQMGKYDGQYCMSRPGDEGAYEIGNVRIITCNQNHEELQHSEQSIEAIARHFRNKPKSEQQKKKMSNSLKGRSFSKETRRKMSIAAKRRCARTSKSAMAQKMIIMRAARGVI